MTYVFYICISLFLLILQTTIIPHLPLFNSFYDLLALFIIYLSLYRPARESLPVVFFLGFVMDNLSASPFMLYVAAYFWLFISVRWITKVLRVGGVFRMVFIVASGILIENLIFIGAVAMSDPGPLFSTVAIQTLGIQVLWAICTGSLFIMSFDYCHKGWEKILNRYIVQKGRVEQ